MFLLVFMYSIEDGGDRIIEIQLDIITFVKKHWKAVLLIRTHTRSALASSTLFCLIPCPFPAYDAIWKKSRLNVNLSLCAEIIQIGALNFRNSCRWSNVCHGCSTVIDSISYQPHACLLCTINCTIPLRPRTGATNVYMWQLEATVMMINAPLPPHTHTPTSH